MADTPSEATAATGASSSRKRPVKSFFDRYLSPTDRLSETIYGVLIVMTFTLATRASDLLVSDAGDPVRAVRRLMLAAFGCALAWGIIDGVMYILTSLAERSYELRFARMVAKSQSEDEAVEALEDQYDDTLLEMIPEEERHSLSRRIYAKLRNITLSPTGIQREDVLGALAIFLLALFGTAPVVIPFVLAGDPVVALRASNLIAVLMLFLVGYRWAKAVDANPWKIGLALSGIGVAIVLVAIPLGG